MKRWQNLLAGLTLATLASQGWSVARHQDPPPATRNHEEATLREAVEGIVAGEMTRQDAVGVAVGVVKDGKVLFTEGYGFADREGAIPVSNETMFRWASISKPLTAFVAGQLAVEGKLDLDADIREYLPEFPVKNPKHPITTRQLLGHLGGIVHYTNGPVIPTFQNDYPPNPYKSVILALDTFKKSPLVSEPGAEFNYSTHGYILASAVVERAGGKPFHELVKERINAPLTLTTLRPDYQWEEIPLRAVGYRTRGGQVVPSTNTDVSWKLGGGGFISSIDDLAGFAAGLLDPRFMTPELRKILWKRLQTTGGKTTRYGLGFGVRTTDEDRLIISHSGAQEKTRTLMQVFPAERAAVVVMTNSEHVKPLPIANAIAELVLE